jgi:hypothetical protein
MFLEILDMSMSHSCACTCSVMAILCACYGSDLYVTAYGGFSLNFTSCTISARVRMWKVRAGFAN